MHWSINPYEEKAMDAKVLGMTRVGITIHVQTDPLLCSMSFNTFKFMHILDIILDFVTLFNRRKFFSLTTAPW